MSIRVRKISVAATVIGCLLLSSIFYGSKYKSSQKEVAELKSQLAASGSQLNRQKDSLKHFHSVYLSAISDLKDRSSLDSVKLSKLEKDLVKAYNENKRLNSKLELQSISVNTITVRDTILIHGGCNGLEYTDKHLEIGIVETLEGTKISYRYFASTSQEIVVNRANKWFIGRLFKPKFKVDVLNTVDDPNAEISNSYHFVVKK